MTARDQIRAMLDQLMGSQDGSTKANVPFSDPRVCRPFLLGCCPHEILSGTRVDLGECSEIHEYALRADYERAAKEKNLFYELDALDVLNRFVVDCDRKTDHAKRKLRETQEELGEEAARKMNAIHELGELVGTKLAKAEELGAQGLVDESMKLLDEVEQLKRQKSDAEHEFRSTMPASTYQQQKLRVCEVCSAYLGIHDNDRRLADHFGGKLHLGFIQIREKLTDLKKRVSEWKEKRDLDRKQRRSPSFTRTTAVRNDRGDQRMDRTSGGGFARDEYRSSNSRTDGTNERMKHRTRSRSHSRRRSSRDKRRSRSRSDSKSRHSSKRSKHSKSSSHRRHKRSRSRSQSRHRRSKSRSHSKKHSSSHHRHKHDRHRSSNYSSPPAAQNGREQQERTKSSTSGTNDEKQLRDNEEGEEDQQNEDRKLMKILKKYEDEAENDNELQKSSEVVQEEDNSNTMD